MNAESTGYDAARIRVLEGREAIRKRPGMYVGSTGVRGLHHMLLDEVGRAVNASLSGRGGRVEVTLTPDGGVRVTDDGPGTPFEDCPDTGRPGLETQLTRPFTGAREHHDRSTVLMAPWVGGPGVTNALSSRLTAEVRREGVRRVQEFARGVALAPPCDAGPATGSGTTITFLPDAEIFDTVEYAYAVLAARLTELAFLNPGLDLVLTDERSPDRPQRARLRFPGGVREFVTFLDALAGEHLAADVIAFEREDPRMAGSMEVALSWSGTHGERVRGFANSLATSNGGTHETGLREGVAAAVDAYARERGLLTAADPEVTADRVGADLTAVVSVKLDRIEPADSTRLKLGNVAVRPCVAEAVRAHLGTWLEEHPREAEDVVDRFLRGPVRG
ncbi:ATP-binding protein [Streptomyces sp. A0592]|uniref:ATP-binding protein n=1 Tax=Streptomyces sp. A0592 TaxID=2563099 RepID=UPI00109EC6AC|nr:ATP-binding protein [Streptomyces sp. A0592]THA86117.1 DNA gyrase subunit B [Streptomyces sp. A0592]